MAYDVFLSYSRQDAAVADRVVRFLTDGGLSCFCDRTNLAGGAEWVAALRDGLRASRVCLFLASAASVGSSWTLDELLEAREARLPIVTCLLAPELHIDGPVLFVVRGRQYLPGHDPDRHLPALLRALRLLVDRQRHPAAYADSEAVAGTATFRSEETGAERGVTLTLHPQRPEAIERSGSHWIVRSPKDAYHGSALGNIPRLLDLVVSATIDRLDGDDEEWVGFELGAFWPGHYYQVLVDGGHRVRIARHWGDRWEHVAQRADLRLDPCTSRKLTAVRRGERLHAFLDGLHALSCDMPTGHAGVGIVIGRNLRVRFGQIEIRGVDTDDVFRRWDRFDSKAAKPWLEQIATSPFGPDDGVARAARLLAIAGRGGWPDRRESLLLVVGAGVLAQLHEGPLAQRLAERVAAASNDPEFRWARAVTDVALEHRPEFAACPLISLGGPASNRFTGRLASELPEVATDRDGVHVHHDLEAGARRIALFGDDENGTTHAVEWFVSQGLLGRFLTMLWTGA
jgi:hypothetical protein